MLSGNCMLKEIICLEEIVPCTVCVDVRTYTHHVCVIYCVTTNIQ